MLSNTSGITYCLHDFAFGLLCAQTNKFASCLQIIGRWLVMEMMSMWAYHRSWVWLGLCCSSSSSSSSSSSGGGGGVAGGGGGDGGVGNLGSE